MSRLFTVLKPCVIDHQFHGNGELVAIRTRDQDKQFVKELIAHDFIREWSPDSYKERQNQPHAMRCDLGGGMELEIRVIQH